MSTQKEKVTLVKRKIDWSQQAIIILVIAIFLLLVFTTENFLSYDNIYTIIFGVSMHFFASIGFTYLMIMGEMDMSIGAMYGFSGMLAGYLTSILKWNFWMAVPVTLVVCALIGALQGSLIIKFRLNSMMVTIGSMTILIGVKALLNDKMSALVFVSDYRNFIKFRIGNIHWCIILCLILVILLEILLKKSVVFKRMFYIGQNRDTAKIYGIRSDRIKLAVFTLSAFCAAFGGIMAASRVAHASTATGEGLEFTIVTAAVLGGASLFGGKGSILRTFLGLIFLSLLETGMICYAINPYVQRIILGAALIFAVLIDISINKSRNRG